MTFLKFLIDRLLKGFIYEPVQFITVMVNMLLTNRNKPRKIQVNSDYFDSNNQKITQISTHVIMKKTLICSNIYKKNEQVLSG